MFYNHTAIPNKLAGGVAILATPLPSASACVHFDM